jgi:ATP-dependent helicase/nuclease subunit B
MTASGQPPVTPRDFEEPTVPMVALAATTPTREARMAMAVVDELRGRGVAIRDIIVVARSIDQYEDALVRAAVRYGIPVTVWTQLPLGETEPYALCAALCTVLGADEVTLQELCTPVRHGWVPSSPSDAWPVEPAALQTVCRQGPDEARSLGDWDTWLAAASVDENRVAAFASWAAAQPAPPTPADVGDVLGGVLKRYRAQVLPHRYASATPALLETEQTIRALVRMLEVVDRIEAKFAEWLADQRAPQSWATVGRMCESFATQRPGRREHGNARALDLIEANDAWGRQVPYVIAVGLADGVWPRRSNARSKIPVEIQQRVLGGHDGLAQLAPRLAWNELRTADQFADTIHAASQGLVLTRHTATETGEPRRPSPFLEALDEHLTSIDPSTAAGLVHVERHVPAALAKLLPTESETSSTTQ